MSELELAMILLGILFLLLFSGVWIGISLFCVGIIGLAFAGQSMTGALAWIVWKASNMYALTCLPLFIFMGVFLSRGGITEQIFSGLSPWLYKLPGRLLHINVVACTIFAAMCGSSAVTTATIATVTIPELRKRGYGEGLSIGSLAGSGTLGFLIPPSIPLIVYGTIANQSIGQLFIAGVIPGLMISLLFMFFIIVIARLQPGVVGSYETYSWYERLKSIRPLVPSMLLILAVLGSIYAGWATAVEAAAVGVLGAFLVTLGRGRLSWQTVKDGLLDGTRLTAMSILIILGALVFGSAFSYLRIPTFIAEAITSSGLPNYGILAILAFFYLVLGCLFEGFSMLVMTIPIVLPVIIHMGFDTIWFGVFLVILIEAAQITPPVGFNLFVLSAITKKDLFRIAFFALPFFFILLLALVIITVQPQIVLWLPSKMI